MGALRLVSTGTNDAGVRACERLYPRCSRAFSRTDRPRSPPLHDMAIQRLIALAIAPGLVACLGCADLGAGAGTEGADGNAVGVRSADGGNETSDAAAGAGGTDSGQIGTASSDAG